MKNRVTRIVRSVIEWIRPARRVQPEPRITPERLRDALREMLADPETRNLVLRSLVGTVFPIAGGQCTTEARNVSNVGVFGANCAAGDYSFPTRVGIGTSTPTHTLDVQSNGETRVAVLGPVAPQFRAQDLTNDVVAKLQALDADVFVGAESNHKLNLIVNNMAKAVIDTAGNVGIGTTGPGAQLHVKGAGQNTNSPNPTGSMGGALILQDTGMSVNNGGFLVFGAGQGFFAGIKGLIIDGEMNTGGDLIFTTRTSDLATLQERMRIMADGKVGIGTTNPLAKLAVKGSSFQATGTVSTTANSPLVTGSPGPPSTKFLSEVKVGDRITIQGVTKTVVKVNSDTELEAHSKFTSALSGTMTVHPSLLRIEDADGILKAFLTGDGSLVFKSSRTKQSSGGPELITAIQPSQDDVILWGGLSTDTEARFLMSARGFLEWGAGGTSDQDVALYRDIGVAGSISIQSFNGSASDQAFRVNKATTGGVGQDILRVDTVNNSVRINGASFGATLDVKSNSSSLPTIRAEQSAASAPIFAGFVTGDSQRRFVVNADGTLSWGDGSMATDTSLFRSAADTLRTPDKLIVDDKVGIGNPSPNFILHTSGAAVALGAPSSAPADGNLNNSNVSFWLDESGAGKLKVKVKFSNGTVKTATIAFDP